jgi:hypothetical protein
VALEVASHFEDLLATFAIQVTDCHSSCVTCVARSNGLETYRAVCAFASAQSLIYLLQLLDFEWL